MDSKRVRWEDLLPDLLAIIHGNPQDVADLVRFRWVCRSWRISAASLPNKLSPFFPLKLPHPHDNARPDLTINANAVYLVRHRRHPSKPLMVSVQEPVPGNLVLRHALTYEEIPIPDGGNDLFDLSPDDWILTQVARSYSRNDICERCNGTRSVKKVTMITDSSRGSIQLDGYMYNYKKDHYDHGFFVLYLGGEVRQIEWDHVSFKEGDFVNVNGWIYNGRGHFYLVDHKKSRLLLVARIGDHHPSHMNPEPSFHMWLVVSDGDLYAVATYGHQSFWIYRLVIEEHTDDGMITRGEWRRVEDLGERVFFLATNCSFSVSARDLPHPWEGNCFVYYLNRGRVCCSCRTPRGIGQISLFLVEGQSPRQSRISLLPLKDYCDLFAPMPDHA